MKESYPVYLVAMYLDCASLFIVKTYETVFPKKKRKSRTGLYVRDCCYRFTGREMDPRERSTEQFENYKKCMQRMSAAKQ